MGTIDDYLSSLDPADRDVIARLYAIAWEEVPSAEQGKGYGMPALVHNGKPLLSVMRAKKHIGVYPFSPESVAAIADDLASHPGIGLDKGTIRFQPEHPLPDDAVRRLVAARKAQIEL
ncbi:iron chaperone [Leifsonia sp. A12D58]|uniref:iron chaperone n=1 Tax=Leifsonia sp. A12D58 TaxID=3397674 RepID=UPI0039E147E8